MYLLVFLRVLLLVTDEAVQRVKHDNKVVVAHLVGKQNRRVAVRRETSRDVLHTLGDAPTRRELACLWYVASVGRWDKGRRDIAGS